MNLSISESGYLWIFFSVFLIHLSEEFLGGTRSPDPEKLHGLDLSRGGFIRANAVALVLFGGTIVLALRLGFPQFLLVALATFVLLNGGRHVVKSVSDLTYSPGLVTGVLAFLPLGVWTLIRLEPAMSHLRFGKAIAAGFGMQIGASFVGHRGRQFMRIIRPSTAPPPATRELLSMESETVAANENLKG